MLTLKFHLQLNGREALVNELLKNQNDDGGWTWSGEATSDSDTTAMVLTALAPYVESNADVKSAVDEAVKYLSAQYKNSKIDNSSTAAQVVIALSALSIDSHSSLFSKDGVSLIDFCFPTKIMMVALIGKVETLVTHLQQIKAIEELLRINYF